MVISRKRPSNGFFKDSWTKMRNNATWYGWPYALTPKIINKFYIFIRNWFKPFNVIHIKTLKRSYQEIDDLMFHALFQLLVNFVEKQWTKGNPGGYGTFINIMEENERLLNNGTGDECRKLQINQLEKQNRDTQEIWDLYNWWTKDRPARKEPEYDRQGYDPHKFVPVLDENGKETELSSLIDNNEDPNKLAAWKKHMEEWSAFEDKCLKEDEDMFFRLIHIRKSLWT